MRYSYFCHYHLASVFFYNDSSPSQIYTLSLHDALPISDGDQALLFLWPVETLSQRRFPDLLRSEEHTSELQSQSNLVCRLLLEKKKNVNRSFSQSLMCQFTLQIPLLHFFFHPFNFFLPS